MLAQEKMKNQIFLPCILQLFILVTYVSSEVFFIDVVAMKIN